MSDFRKLKAAVGVFAVASMLALGLIAARSMHAQQNVQPSLRVAVVNSFPDPDARSLVMREGARAQTITIVLRRDAMTEDVLGTSLVLARRLRTEALAPTATQVVRVTGTVRTKTLPDAIVRRLTAILGELRAQPTVQIGNLGSGQWLDVTQAVSR